MKRFRIAALLLAGVLAVSTLFAGEEYPLRPAVECAPRGGLPNFFAKLKEGKEVTIVYFGGSITAQDGWRVLSQKWFEGKYPNAKVKAVHAAIGGTGSDLGVFRLDHDVLVAKPDLVFVEFATNDGGASPDNIKKAMEGIVRKIWKADATTDICYVYTVTNSRIKPLQQDEPKMNRSESVMEEVADRYGIPSIHMGLEVAKLEKEGKLAMSAEKADMTRVSGDELNEASSLPVGPDGKIPFAKDGVHPYTNTGHTLYMNAIARSIPSIEAAGTMGAHTLPEPVIAGNWENAKMIPLETVAPGQGWTKLDPEKGGVGKNFYNRVGIMWKGEPGAELTFKFKGTKASLYSLKGPDCGMVEITLDGTAKKAQNIDGYCTYHRLSTLGIGDNLADTEHTVTVKVLDEAVDKAKILFEKNREDMEKNPDKYKATNFYAGAIFLIGDLVTAP